jgi:hypothetical protein
VVSAGVEAKDDLKGIVESMEKLSVVNQDSGEKGLQTQNTLVYRAKDFIKKPNMFSYGYAEFHEFEQVFFRIYYCNEFSDDNKVKLVNSMLAGQAAAWSKTYLASRMNIPSGASQKFNQIVVKDQENNPALCYALDLP